jgi:hypothetical protein
MVVSSRLSRTPIQSEPQLKASQSCSQIKLKWNRELNPVRMLVSTLYLDLCSSSQDDKRITAQNRIIECNAMQCNAMQCNAPTPVLHKHQYQPLHWGSIYLHNSIPVPMGILASNSPFTANLTARPQADPTEQDNQPFSLPATSTDRVPEAHGGPRSPRCAVGPYGLPRQLAFNSQALGPCLCRRQQSINQSTRESNSHRFD